MYNEMYVHVATETGRGHVARGRRPASFCSSPMACMAIFKILNLHFEMRMHAL